MECAYGDARLAHSPLFTQLSLEIQDIITGSTSTDNQTYLSTLSALALEPSLTGLILTCYEPLFAELVSRWPSFASLCSIAGALGRILPLQPYLDVYAQEFLTSDINSRYSFWDLIPQLPENSIHQSIKDFPIETIMEKLLSLYRLLRFRRDQFVALVEPVYLSLLLSHSNHVIRFLVVKILCIFLNAGDSQEQDMVSNYLGEDAVMGAYEGERVDYGFLVLLESKRLSQLEFSLEEARINTNLPPLAPSRVIPDIEFTALAANLCGILVPRIWGSPMEPFGAVMTSSTQINVRSIAQALHSTQPLLITGPAGSGKSFLIHEIARSLHGSTNMISIHLGDQTDAKLLIGTYTAGSIPGSFQWRPGILTTAVREGRWVLIEDIDKAPTEVLSVLLPLIERRELNISSRDEKVVAGRGFRLITTIRTSLVDTKASTANINILGSRLWNRVDLQPPSEEELRTIINKKFPPLQAVSGVLLDVYKALCALYRESARFSTSNTSLGRQISPRDLIKWCLRVNALFACVEVDERIGTISESLLYEIFMEAIDCFAAHLQTNQSKSLVIGRVAEIMQVPTGRVELFLRGHIPSFHKTGKSLTIGRAKLVLRDTRHRRRDKNPFAKTGHALRLLEQIGVAVRSFEPILLVGETGTGKTTVVQQLANMLGYTLTVINLSQQTESSDLLGGYKPMDMRTLTVPLKDSFEGLFEKTFSMRRNASFIEMLNKYFSKQQWERVLALWKQAIKKANDFLTTILPQDNEPKKKKRRVETLDRRVLQAQWTQFAHDLNILEAQASHLSKSFAFSFIEGSLVKAARTGDWVLLDEINLAAPDTLESITDLLKQGGQGSILLSEKGVMDRIVAHPNFRIFGCMNPATDIGKRDLPPGLRSRFTELYVASPDSDIEDLLPVVKEYIGHLCLADEKAPADISRLYLQIKQLADGHNLVDGAGHRPHFSLRTLTRTLSYVIDIIQTYGLRRSLYEGFSMTFLTLLDTTSKNLLLPLLDKHILDIRNTRSLLNQIPKRPETHGESYIQFKHYWMHRGSHEVQEQLHYIITPFVERNLLNLVRATATKRFPVLIQGPTSSGKTSMIEFLARRTGHRFVRINNHEHTDLQEYLGTYFSDSDGRLKFREGILVEALRKGHWIVLDELNLAPMDVLEALNRLLDDNRELLIPETQEVVRPHKEFMLFATQNPPGVYGGRKVLSRAFRNRFLELHFDDIPESDLETILKERCQIAPSYCTKIVAVYKELSLLRQTTRLFEQKNSFATLRDLFRWANREAVGYQRLAENGFMLLAERVRRIDDKTAVKKVIEKVMRVTISDEVLYQPKTYPEFMFYNNQKGSGSIVWTKAMRRLFVLVVEALRNNEPVLLVGETGCGKTTICQMLAQAFGKQLFIVNAHQNTEAGDIVGAHRPIRNRTAHSTQLHKDLIHLFTEYVPTSKLLELKEISLEDLILEFDSLSTIETLEGVPGELLVRIQQNRTRVKALFQWADGSLVTAMKEAQFFLLDEISLAEDSVLERLNSVLEPHRTLILAEKGSHESEVVAVDGFQFLATMNPGGDYGKRELSPALRNRFTEIWVPAMADLEDVTEIITSKLHSSVKKHVTAMVNFSNWFSEAYGSGEKSISMRDILSWVKFVNMYSADSTFALIHGVSVVFLDRLGANPSGVLTNITEDLRRQKESCVRMLSDLTRQNFDIHLNAPVTISVDDTHLRVGPFNLTKGPCSPDNVPFNLQAPTTAMNVLKVVRAMQLRKPILLEGSPGVGKTSLISALASASGHPLIRINLSEQTDVMDLFGSDVPADSGLGGEFMWRNAPFLRAMQKGHWVLLDEMNLASQSILEGLNACLDYRREAYIAELDRTFTAHPDFLVFASQNPHHQGGGRKGLPASFVNRFTVVHIDSFSMTDLQMISMHLYPTTLMTEATRVITFITKLSDEVTNKASFGQLGAPWQFNLRDILRWLELLSSHTGLTTQRQAGDFMSLVVRQRFRTPQDRAKVDQLYTGVFGQPPKTRRLFHRITKEWIQVGHALIPRRTNPQLPLTEALTLLIRQLPILETMMTCIERKWPCILVGPSGSGKSSVIRLLASVAGYELDEMALNTDIDTMDIVGGFEQADVSRKIKSQLLELESYTRQATLLQFLKGTNPRPEDLKLLEAFKTQTAGMNDLCQLTTHLENVIPHHPELEECYHRLGKLIQEREQCTNNYFNWVDGMLVRAVQEGRWLVLDNANLCSASVLDRLNSLLEPGGSLVVNEHSDEDGEPKLIYPHPSFRLFITMDPKHGELSRAMRNRGVEIYMEPYPASSPVAMIEDRRKIAISKYAVSTAADSVFPTLQLLDPPRVPQDMVSFFRVSMKYIPIAHQNLLLRWRVMLSEGGKQGSLHLDLIDTYLDLFSHKKLRKLIFEYFSHSLRGIKMDLSSTFCSAQSLHPLVNSSLLRCSESYPPEISPYNLAAFYDIVFDISKMTQTLRSILQRSNIARMGELTILEKSALQEQAANISESIGSNLFAFLSAILSILQTWSTVSLDLEEVTLRSVHDLIHIWWDTTQLGNSSRFDESIFYVYLMLYKEWANKNEPFLPHAFVQSIRASLHMFKSRLQLTTGFSMETLWEHIRPSVPSTIEGWESYVQLHTLATRFDAIIAQCTGPLEELISLRQSLAQALAISLLSNSNSETLAQELNNQIGKIEIYQRNGQLQSRETFLTSQFDHLLKSRDLQAAVSLRQQCLDNTITLNAYYAGRPTSSLLSYQKSNFPLHFAFPSILQDIWAFPKCFEAQDRPRQFIHGTYGLSLLKTCVSAVCCTIEQLPALQSEIVAFRRLLVSYVSDILQDRVLNLQLLLLSSIHVVFNAHRSFYCDEHLMEFDSLVLKLKSALCNKSAIPQLKGLDASISSASNPQINEIMNKYILPAITLVSSAGSPMQEALHNTGRAWILYAQGCLKLYVPNYPLDPAMKSIVHRERFLRRKEELKSEIDENGQFELQYTGQDSNPIIEQLRQKLESLGDKLPNSLIARPADSQIEHIQDDLSVLLSTINGESEYMILQSILQRTAGYQEEEQLLQQNLQQIIERLQNKYPMYKDMIDPLVGFLYSLKLGYAMVAMNMCDEEVPKTTELLLSHSSILNQASKDVKTTSEEKLIYYLWILGAQSQIEGLTELEKSSITATNHILHTLYRNWKITTIKEQEKARINAATYRYRGVEGDDGYEIKEMFPDYTEEGEDNSSVDGQIQPAKQTSSSLAVQIAKCHMGIFFPKENSVLSLKQLIVRGVSLCMTQWSDGTSNKYIPPSELELLLPAQILTLKDTESRLSGHNYAIKNYDFYKNENMEQVQKLVVILDKLQYRIIQLIQIWPENVTLQDALEACQQMMKLPNTTPVAKFLTYIEKLHRIIYEWQGVASKQYSLIENFDSLTQLTISWRRLELQAWPRLFDIEDENFQSEADAWWFFLYENIIANPMQLVESGETLDEHIGFLLSTLSSFIQNSTVGQFQARLRLLSVFQAHVQGFLHGQHQIAEAINHLVSYYTEYISIVAERIAAARKTAEKEITEVILLASWKDTNITALRESARRSHYKLYKIVRKYRALLGEPILHVLQGRMPTRVLNNTDSTPRPKIDTVSPQSGMAQIICATFLDSWQDRPKRFADITGTVQSMRSVSTLKPDLPDAVDIIDSFASRTASLIEDFQSLTPSVLLDENKDEVKHLKTRKRVAYTATLRALRKMGLKSNLSSKLLAKQESPEKIFASILPLDANCDIVNTIGVTTYFNHTIEGLSSVRRSAQDHSSDLSSTEVLRNIGFIEHLVHLAIQQRNGISKAITEFTSLKKILDTYGVIASNLEDGIAARLYGGDLVDDNRYMIVKRVFKWLPRIFDYVLDVLKTHAEFLGVPMVNEVSKFTEWRGLASEMNRRFSTSKPLYDGVWDYQTKQLMDTAISLIDSFHTGLQGIESSNPNIKYLSKQVSPWLVLAADVAHSTNISPAKIISLKELDISLQSLCDSILVALQQLSNTHTNFPIAEDEQDWFLKYQATSLLSIKGLHMGDITRKIQENISILVSLQSYNEVEPQVIRSLFAAYYPVVEQYKMICHGILSRLTLLHRATCKMTYILSSAAATISAKGFCTPPEKSDEKSDTGKIEGTGLGEGEGMEDISNEIGADEDLSEMAQETSKEQDRKEIQDEKDAINVEDEMDGQMGDSEEGVDKDNQEEGNEGEGEEDEMDEETGKVDELDPTAVDEKLWDEKGDDDSREQEGYSNGNHLHNDIEAKKENGKEAQVKPNVESVEGEEEDLPADEHDEVKESDVGGVDQSIPKVDTLDLPDNMNLDQHEEEPGSENGMDIDDLSDLEAEEEPGAEEDGKMESDTFPEEGETEETNETPVETELGEERKDEKWNKDDEGVPDQTEESEGIRDSQLQNTSQDLEATEPSGSQSIVETSDGQQGNEANFTRQSVERREGLSNQGPRKSHNEFNTEGMGQQADEIPHNNQEELGEQQDVERSSFRKVGEILERWYRQQKKILDGMQEEEHQQIDDMDLDGKEFEHLYDENTVADTQAMGIATGEQADASKNCLSEDEMLDEMMDEKGNEKMSPSSANDSDTTPSNDDDLRQQKSNAQNNYAGVIIGSHDTIRQNFNGDGIAPKLEDFLPETLNAAHQSMLLPIEFSHSQCEVRTLWQRYEQSTRSLSFTLTEQLRLILEPTFATKMRGEFRTGKRLNMKRIIPFIASEYRKDKIWMRRTKPSKRQYQVMISIDDSKSMAETEGCVDLAFETVVLVSRALAMLEVGQIGILRFGEVADMVHPFSQPFTADAGIRVLQSFTFNQQKTNVTNLLQTSITLFEAARAQSQSPANLWQLQLIISDGVCEDHDCLQRLVRRALEAKVMVVFVIVDAAREGSILEMSKVKFVEDDMGGSRLVMERYLDTFPFGYYLIVRNVRELPEVLASALRQWLQEVVETEV